MTIYTSDQIEQHVGKTFPGLHAQVSLHAPEQASIQVFDLGSNLVIDIDVERISTWFDVDLANVDALIRAEFPRLVEKSR